jgi:hypothetical protein
MNNNEFIINAVKGEPNSLTSIAFHTGTILERERIIKLLQEVQHLDGLPGIKYAIAVIKSERENK